MTLRLVWRSSRPMTVALGLLTLVGGLVPLGVAYAGKRIVDAVVAHVATTTPCAGSSSSSACVVTLAIVQRGLGLVRSLLGARLGIDINVTILEKALGLDLRFFEDPDFYDKLTRARREASSRPIALVTESFGLVQSIITLVGYAALLVRFSGWAVLALGRRDGARDGRRDALLEARLQDPQLALARVASPALSRVRPRERRAREGGQALRPRAAAPRALQATLARSSTSRTGASTSRSAKWTQLLSLLGTGTFYGAYAAMALMAAAGALTLGNMTLYVIAFRQGQQAFQSALAAIGDMYEHNLYMSNLWEYLALSSPSASRRARAPRPRLAPARRASGIVLEDVGFRYPGKDAWALAARDPRHPRRREPRARRRERRRQDDTREAPHAPLRADRGPHPARRARPARPGTRRRFARRFGVLFQDFNQYQLKVRENVGLGSVDHLEDVPRIERAIERGGAREVVAALPAGLDAPLGRWFHDGTELSGGQWQKIALARAFMREEADILVLDEPTASLDAEAEHAVFERFRALAAGAHDDRHLAPVPDRAHGPPDRRAWTTGSSSSRAPTTSSSPAAGKYARMFALQAEGYR